MSEYSKKFQDKEELKKASIALKGYQKRHNIIRKDYELLLRIAETFQDDKEEFNSLYRASLKSFFSLIESDIFGLNQIDEYEGYNDLHRFEDKFKKTFKNICKTCDKDNIILQYLDSKYGTLKSIKEKRDKLVHPKTTEDIVIATQEEFLELKSAFEDYTKMLHSIMDNFFISINVNVMDLFKR